MGPLRIASAWMSVARIGALVAVACVACTPGDGRSRTAPPSESTAYEGIDVEAVLNDQEQMIDRAAARLAPERPGVTDLYVMGFAGFADEDVFYNEALGGVAVLDARLDTAGRSLLLVNRIETLEDLPLASRTNLRQALKRVAARMNPDEDILFLLVTSHGGSDSIAVRHGPFPLADLSARDLRRALDDSGIAWRVIVVSACFSGSFIDDLEDAGTLVLTAARRDRSSFGCANGRDFTEFGRAYFGEALWHETSFVAAFERAKRTIAAAEAAFDLTPSEPQMFEGTAIRAKLRELEWRLANP
ncbi:MAG: hypothetical protein EXQ94_08530 [Alphaproteobacteria bacterium]|nr:hypothetical protein [Alphaproteobacteria bacterium]